MLTRLFTRFFGFNGELYDPALLPDLQKENFPLTVGVGDHELTVVVISDTHLQNPDHLPDGDVLIHCGDFLNHDAVPDDITKFNEWLGKQTHKEKIVICGNHEILMKTWDAKKIQETLSHAIYLHHESYTLESGLSIFGSPYTHARNCLYKANAFAKNLDTLQRKFDSIPEETDILVTHIPSLGVLDETYIQTRVGSSALLKNVQRVKPLLHLCGHNHDECGAVRLEETVVVNAAQLHSNNGPYIVTIKY